MPYSARALGEAGLRLRSRRMRSNRSQRLSGSVILAVLVVGSLVGFIGPNLFDGLRLPTLNIPGWLPASATPPAEPSPRSAAVRDADAQRYVDDLLPIHARLMQAVVRMGVLAASLGSDEDDPDDLKPQIEQTLALYRRTEEQVIGLHAPPDLRTAQSGYLTASRLFERSAMELLRTFDDRDTEHIAAAAPYSLEAMASMRALGEELWPK